MARLFLYLIAGISGLWLADRYIEGVIFRGPLFILPTNEKELGIFFSSLFFVGALLGFLNFFLKPILNLITLPLRIITLGLFSFIINLFLVKLTDIIFEELDFLTFVDLILTTLIIWTLTILILALFPRGKSLL